MTKVEAMRRQVGTSKATLAKDLECTFTTLNNKLLGKQKWRECELLYLANKWNVSVKALKD